MNDFSTLITNLLQWYYENKRILPWRETKNPYNIWVSEIILQQTRVNQGLEYYKRFVGKFKSVNDLANANIEDVLKVWQGLGYYSRARNMHVAANQILKLFNGKFPENIDELKTLKGIGDYTAAAIASIAFNKPVALVDGNVYRVLSRLFGIKTPIGTIQSYREFAKLSTDLMQNTIPGEYNQALMELGALVCMPQNPDCINCPLQAKCFANEKSVQELFPIKRSKAKVRDRYFYYVVIVCNEKWIMRKRNEKDIWQNLCDFPLIESDILLNDSDVFKNAEILFQVSEKEFINKTPVVLHKLTHQNLYATFYCFKVKNMPELKAQNYFIVHSENISKHTVPRLIDKYLKNEFGFKK